MLMKPTFIGPRYCERKCNSVVTTRAFPGPIAVLLFSPQTALHTFHLLLKAQA
jgi:hypothetical protein